MFIKKDDQKYSILYKFTFKGRSFILDTQIDISDSAIKTTNNIFDTSNKKAIKHYQDKHQLFIEESIDVMLFNTLTWVITKEPSKADKKAAYLISLRRMVQLKKAVRQILIEQGIPYDEIFKEAVRIGKFTKHYPLHVAKAMAILIDLHKKGKLNETMKYLKSLPQRTAYDYLTDNKIPSKIHINNKYNLPIDYNTKLEKNQPKNRWQYYCTCVHSLEFSKTNDNHFAISKKLAKSKKSTWDLYKKIFHVKKSYSIETIKQMIIDIQKEINFSLNHYKLGYEKINLSSSINHILKQIHINRNRRYLRDLEKALSAKNPTTLPAPILHFPWIEKHRIKTAEELEVKLSHYSARFEYEHEDNEFIIEHKGIFVILDRYSLDIKKIIDRSSNNRIAKRFINKLKRTIRPYLKRARTMATFIYEM